MRKLILLVLWLLPGEVWPQQAEPLIFLEKAHDFGDILEANGSADVEFVFTNNSGRPVKILSVQASCGCTTPGWSKNTVPYGKTGFIKASFDPKGRPGYFNKSLTVISDLDPIPIVLQIKGQVVTSQPPGANDFMVASGNLRLKTKSFNMGTIYINKETTVRQFPVMNAGTVPIRFLTVEKPAHVRVEMPSVLGPQARGVIKVFYDGKMKNQFGFASDNILFTTDDLGAEAKPISLFATLEEFYPLPTAEELLKAPHAILREQSIDLGRSRAGTAIERNVMVINSGKKDLQIKALKGNCSCISADATKRTIHPGDSAQIKIIFNPQRRGGTQQKAIALYSNDPRKPVQLINLQIFIED